MAEVKRSEVLTTEAVHVKSVCKQLREPVDSAGTDPLNIEAANLIEALYLAALPTLSAAQAVPDPLRAAAERVCWFDWSDNDMDACAAMDALRKALTMPSADRP